MRIAIIGAGRLARILAHAWSKAGHTITFGVRNSADAKVQALTEELGPSAKIASPQEAVKNNDVVVPAVPWSSYEAVLKQLGDLSGKILVDCSSPFKPIDRSDPAAKEELAFGYDTSGAEHVAQWTPGAKVVLAFNGPGIEVLAEPAFGNDRATMFLCGDDSESKVAVSQLARDAGFDVCDAGALHMARYVEPLNMVWIDMARNQKRGSNFAFKLINRGEGLLAPA